MKFPLTLDQFEMGAIHKRAMLSSKVTLSRTSIHFIINHYHLESVVYWVAGRGLSFSHNPKSGGIPTAQWESV